MMPYFSYPFVPQYGQQPGMQFGQPFVQPFTQPVQSFGSMYVPFMPEYGTDMEDESGVTRDPPPILSDNPPVTAISLFKELTGYPNYGNPSGNADILYTGNRGAWTFNSPAFLAVPGNQRAQIVIRAVLDDHAEVAVNRYSATITINGSTVHTGQIALVHGVPAGGRFTNWRQLTFNVPVLRRNNRVVITNTSTAGPNDWIAFDWMELRLTPRI